MMKFTSWQLVVLVAVMFTAIIASQVFAPGVASTVVAMATALFGTLFVQRETSEKQ